MSRTHGHPDDRATWPVRAALACYPAPWRARYGEELQATLAQLPRSGASTARAVVDLGIGAIDAWLHPIPDPRSKPVTDETTRLIPPTAWGLLLFLFGGAAFAKVNDDPAFTAATHHHPALAACFYALAISAFAAAGVMGLATLPSLVLLLRQGRAQARHDAAPLIAVPLALAWFAGAILVARSLGGQWGPHAAVNVALFIGLCCVSVGVGVVVTIALIRVAVRVPEKPVVVATRRVAMIALAVCTTVAAAAVAGWVVTLAVTERHLLTSNDGLLASPVAPTLAVILAVLTVAATLCVRSGWAVLSSPGGAPRSSR